MQVQERPCRVCGGPLDSILQLGTLALSNFPLPGDPPAETAPLDFCQCGECGLVQLRHTVDPTLMFSHYWYRSGINEAMRAELTDIVKQTARLVRLRAGDLVLDVGANDGTLLSLYPALGHTPFRIGVEPATNLHAELEPHTDLLWGGFFPGDGSLVDLYKGQVRLLTSIAMFYDLDDPGEFVGAVAKVLARDGVWIVQFQDLHQMTRATAFDNICFEHLVYYSLGSFERLIGPYGLRVVHAERRAINGGSYRLIVQHDTTGPRATTVATLRQFEAGCEHWHALEKFAWRVGEARRQIQGALQGHRTIDVYGASTKFNTLSQYCGLDGGIIRQAWERSEAKWGRVTATGIPIVREEQGRADPPDLLVAGIWQFRDAILKREAAYFRQGGTMLFPLPTVDLVAGIEVDSDR